MSDRGRGGYRCSGKRGWDEPDTAGWSPALQFINNPYQINLSSVRLQGGLQRDEDMAEWRLLPF